MRRQGKSLLRITVDSLGPVATGGFPAQLIGSASRRWFRARPQLRAGQPRPRRVGVVRRRRLLGQRRLAPRHQQHGRAHGCPRPAPAVARLVGSEDLGRADRQRASRGVLRGEPEGSGRRGSSRSSTSGWPSTSKRTRARRSASPKKSSTPRAAAKPRARRATSRAAKARSTPRRSPASSPTAPSAIRASARSTSSRATRQAAPRSRDATAASRPSCRSRARSSTSRRRASTRCCPPRRSALMITALGTGIGADDFDDRQAPLPQDHHHDGRRRRRLAHPHADPDVLLPPHAEVIDRGHLYIAQPPLFKVTQGKKDTYLKDESEKSRFLMSRIAESVEVTPEGGIARPRRSADQHAPAHGGVPQPRAQGRRARHSARRRWRSSCASTSSTAPRCRTRRSSRSSQQALTEGRLPRRPHRARRDHRDDDRPVPRRQQRQRQDVRHQSRAPRAVRVPPDGEGVRAALRVRPAAVHGEARRRHDRSTPTSTSCSSRSTSSPKRA